MRIGIAKPTFTFPMWRWLPIATLFALFYLAPGEALAQDPDPTRPVASPQVSGSCCEKRSGYHWLTINWTVGCSGGVGPTTYGVQIYLFEEGEKPRFVTSQYSDSPSGSIQDFAILKNRPYYVYPYILARCYRGGTASEHVDATGNRIRIPAEGGDGGDGDGGGEGGGDGGGGGSDGGGGGGSGGGGGGGGGGGALVPDCENLIQGTARDDELRGTQRDDALLGLGGDDRVTGLGGRDCALGGRGDDRLEGGDGPDRLSGGTGRDRLIAGGDRNHLWGGGGADSVDARNASRDNVWCGGGSDEVHADPNDELAGCEKVRRPSRKNVQA